MSSAYSPSQEETFVVTKSCKDVFHRRLQMAGDMQNELMGFGVGCTSPTDSSDMSSASPASLEGSVFCDTNEATGCETSSPSSSTASSGWPSPLQGWTESRSGPRSTVASPPLQPLQPSFFTQNIALSGHISCHFSSPISSSPSPSCLLPVASGRENGEGPSSSYPLPVASGEGETNWPSSMYPQHTASVAGDSCKRVSSSHTSSHSLPTDSSGKAEEIQVPVSARYLTDKIVVLSYFSEETAKKVDEHFARALTKTCGAGPHNSDGARTRTSPWSKWNPPYCQTYTTAGRSLSSPLFPQSPTHISFTAESSPATHSPLSVRSPRTAQNPLTPQSPLANQSPTATQRQWTSAFPFAGTPDSPTAPAKISRASGSGVQSLSTSHLFQSCWNTAPASPSLPFGSMSSSSGCPGGVPLQLRRLSTHSPSSERGSAPSATITSEQVQTSGDTSSGSGDSRNDDGQDNSSSRFFECAPRNYQDQKK